MSSPIESDVLADADIPKKKSDLSVRLASAIVMVAIAGTALWLGGWFWNAFVMVVGLQGFNEFRQMIAKTPWASEPKIVLGFIGLIYIAAASWALIVLPVAVLIGVIAIVIATDVGAYFSGRAIGGPKIAPKISPSKTWAGLIGGATLAGVVSAGSFVHQTGDLVLRPMLFIAFAIGIVLACLAQAGDFFESWLKRRAGVKDSSNLIPGHGGIFDRVDGLLPVAIVAALLWYQVHPG